MSSFDSSSIVYRPVEKHEQKKALHLWCPIFNNHIDLEERYFLSNASPRYQEGDTLGAWYNDELVSTIHIRRFILQSSEDNKEYLCAGITNVATRMEYRRHGLSRQLLQIAVDKLEKSNEFDISILGTNKPNHYGSFGWEQVPQPIRIMIDWKLHTSLSEIIQWRLASDLSHQDIELMFKIHSENPRFYQMKRSPSTVFHHWVKARWENNAAIVCLYEHEQTQGYVVISKPDREQDICVLEWRASNLILEQKLLSLAATEIRQRYGSTKPIRLFTLPQYMTVDELTEWAGPVQIDTNYEIMVRNIRLSIDIYKKIKICFSDGRAVFWAGDYF